MKGVLSFINPGSNQSADMYMYAVHMSVCTQDPGRVELQLSRALPRERES